MSIYTNQLSSSNDTINITSSDIVMLNGNNIVHGIDDEYNGINPIPSFDVIKSMSASLSSKISNIDETLDNHESRLSSHMQYFGAFTIYKTSGLSNWILSAFLNENLNATSEYVIEKGTMFRFISSVVLRDSNETEADSISVFNNDYFIANNEFAVKDSCISNFNVIRDAQTEVETLSTIIHNELCETSSLLENDIDNKIFIENKISGLSDYSNLSIVKLNADEYHQMVVDGTIISNCAYVVETPFMNLYGEQIKNIAPGTDLSDAMNLEQLNAISVKTLSLANEYSDELLSSNLSNYYTKDETSSSLQLKNSINTINTTIDTISSKIKFPFEIVNAPIRRTGEMIINPYTFGNHNFVSITSAFTVVLSDDNANDDLCHEYYLNLHLILSNENEYQPVIWDNKIDVFIDGNAQTIVPTNGNNIYHIYEYEEDHFAIKKLNDFDIHQTRLSAYAKIIDLSGYVTQDQLSAKFDELSNYYVKSETSSAAEISVKANELSDSITNKIFIENKISGLSAYSNLSIIHLSSSEYASMLSSESLLSNCLYVVEDKFSNTYGQQIKNMAPGTDLSDAVNLEQLCSFGTDISSTAINSAINQIKLSVSTALSAFEGVSDISAIEIQTLATCLKNLYEVMKMS